MPNQPSNAPLSPDLLAEDESPSPTLSEAPEQDMSYIHLTLPVYYTQTFKTKPDKTFLVGLNWYRSAHYFIKNEVKQYYNTLIIEQLEAISAPKLKGPYELAFKYYYKSVVSDLDNVCAMANKSFNDAAQAYGLVENDNVKYCRKSCYYVASQDKDNPRMEVFIRKFTPKDSSWNTSSRNCVSSSYSSATP